MIANGPETKLQNSPEERKTFDLAEEVESLFWKNGGRFSSEMSPLLDKLGEVLVTSGLIREDSGAESHEEYRRGEGTVPETKALEEAFSGKGKERIRELIIMETMAQIPLFAPGSIKKSNAWDRFMNSFTNE